MESTFEQGHPGLVAEHRSGMSAYEIEAEMEARAKAAHSPTYEPDDFDDRDYCDYCESYGHTFSICPSRDDEGV